jgi:hypothetical protein
MHLCGEGDDGSEVGIINLEEKCYLNTFSNNYALFVFIIFFGTSYTVYGQNCVDLLVFVLAGLISNYLSLINLGILNYDLKLKIFSN